MTITPINQPTKMKINFDPDKCSLKKDEFITDNQLGKIDYADTSSVWLIRERTLYLPHGHELQKDVKIVEMLFCEADDKDLSLEDQIANVEKLGLPCPNKILFTGNKSLHFYWRCEQTANINQWKFVQHLLAALVPGGDHALAQTQRQLRLPGVVHKKTGIPSSFQRFHNKTFRMKDIMDQLVKVADARDKNIVKQYYCKVYDDPSTYVRPKTSTLDDRVDPDRAARILAEVASASSWGTGKGQHAKSNAVCYSASLSNVSIPEIGSILQGAGIDAKKIKEILRAVKNGGFHDIGPGYLYWYAGEMGIDISNPDYTPTHQQKEEIVTTKRKTKKTNNNNKTENTEGLLHPFDTVNKRFGYKYNVAESMIFDKTDKPAKLIKQSTYSILKKERIQALGTDGKGYYMNREEAYDAALMVAEANAYNPIIEQVKVWEEKVKNNDYVKMDIDRLATNWLNPKASPYHNSAVKTWLVGAVKRLVEPGCHQRLVLVLSGKQNGGKSTFLEILGREHFTSGINFSNDKEEIAIRRSSWICENAEMNLSKKEANAIKPVISATHDRYVKKYANEPEKAPRNYVFAATTNDTQIFNDDTGNTRFTVVPVAFRYTDQKRLTELRDDLMCNILVALKNGASVELSTEMMDYQAQDNKNFSTEDSWMEIIKEWMRTKPKDKNYCITEVYTECLEGRTENMSNNAISRKIGRILRELGYEPKKIRIGGQKTPVNIFFKVDSGEEENTDNLETMDASEVPQLIRPNVPHDILEDARKGVTKFNGNGNGNVLKLKVAK